jgi:hypothetical protein
LKISRQGHVTVDDSRGFAERTAIVLAVAAKRFERSEAIERLERFDSSLVVNDWNVLNVWNDWNQLIKT